MEEYRPNSNKYKLEQQENQEPAEKEKKKPIEGEASVQKKSAPRKLLDALLSEDVESVRRYLLNDLLIPTIKQTLYEMISNGSRMMILGDSERPRTEYYSPGGARRDYNRISSRREPDSSPARRIGRDYGDISFASYAEADYVLSSLREEIEDYGFVPVGQLFELANIQTTSTDYNYGWSSLQTATISATRDNQWLLRLPRAIPSV